MRISDWSSDVCSSDLHRSSRTRQDDEMAGGCCGGCEETPPTPDTAWRRVLWIAPGINAAVVGVEIVAGVTEGSAALKADSLTCPGESDNSAISTGFARPALRGRAGAARLKGEIGT